MPRPTAKPPQTLPDLDLLETVLSYTFQNRALLERSVTHRSWAHEQVAPGAEDEARRLHNESLEFLGDSVLGLIVADYLCTAYPEVTEGELSRMKHSLVNEPTLAAASARMQLGDFLKFGRGEEKSGGRRKDAWLHPARARSRHGVGSRGAARHGHWSGAVNAQVDGAAGASDRTIRPDRAQ